MAKELTREKAEEIWKIFYEKGKAVGEQARELKDLERSERERHAQAWIEDGIRLREQLAAEYGFASKEEFVQALAKLLPDQVKMVQSSMVGELEGVEALPADQFREAVKLLMEITLSEDVSTRIRSASESVQTGGGDAAAGEAAAALERMKTFHEAHREVRQKLGYEHLTHKEWIQRIRMSEAVYDDEETSSVVKAFRERAGTFVVK